MLRSRPNEPVDFSSTARSSHSTGTRRRSVACSSDSGCGRLRQTSSPRTPSSTACSTCSSSTARTSQADRCSNGARASSEAIRPRDGLQLSDAFRGDAQRRFAEACRSGWEGLIAKRADAPYAHGRSRDWLKLKCAWEQELVIGGYTDPRGSRIEFGALLVGYYEDGRLRYAGKVGTGYTVATLRRARRAAARTGGERVTVRRCPAGPARNTLDAA